MELSAAQGERIARDQANELGKPRIAPAQRPHHRLGGCRHRARGEQRRAHELTQMRPQPLLDQALHQDEDPDRDEEARPGAEIEQERAACERADRMTRHGAEQQRHAPREADQERGAPAGVERPLVQQAEPLLERVERPAAGDQELVDSA